MKRSWIASRTAILAAGFLLALVVCCTGGSGGDARPISGPSGIVVYMTDAPTGYDNVWVTMDEFAVHKSGGAWFSVPLTTSNADTNGDGADDVIVNGDGTVTVDLLALQGLEALFASGQIDPGHYTQLRLRVVSAEAVYGLTTIPLKVPSGAQTGVKIVGEFNVGPCETASILLDFDAHESIVPRGSSGQPPILEPVISSSIQHAPFQPDPPAGVSATPGDSEITLDWSAVACAADYNIYWDTSPGVTKATGNLISGVTAPFLHTSLTNGTTHYYVVTAVNTVGGGAESDESAEVSATPAGAAGGTLRAWGENSFGQLGDGTSGLGTDSSVPVQVLGFPLTGVAAVAGGASHTVALMDDGTLRAWGRNFAGQLGDGTTTDRSVPVQVVDGAGGLLSGVAAVTAGNAHTAALMDDGTLRAWGSNFRGSLGDGTTTNSSVPVQVVDGAGGFLTGVAAVAGGASHTVALMDDGTLRAWGWNFLGSLGDGTTTDRSVPVQVVDGAGGLLTNVAAAAGGSSHTVAMLDDGTVRAWGRNNWGQLGDGSATESRVPVQVVDGAG
ncbi:MAG: DUF4382 domain-containing protein, partial [Planctomycetota bacterium]|nr:DUF4382 domain-containing protein [Planctomycetota bacterium]